MTRKKNTTIIDIAKYLDISHTTVSRALNGSPKVKENTRRKILDAAQTLQYVPNLNARGLNQGRTYTIGLFFTDLENSTSSLFLTSIITNIRTRLPDNYVLSINSISKSETISFFDGVVIVSQSESDQKFINEVSNNNIPLVVLNRYIKNPTFYNYWLDNYTAARELTMHALNKGYKTITSIRGNHTYAYTEDRSRGYYDAIERWLDIPDHKLSIQPSLEGGYSAEGGYKAMKKILRRSALPEYVFIENDDMAIGALHAIHEVDTNSHKIAISGFDDVSLASFTTPSLTTAHSPISEMTSLGIDTLKRLISHEDISSVPFQIGFDMPIIYRDSLTKNIN